ncbi:MAG: hypothetical protein ACYSUC_06870, partial [Planctomycetota bacterium]
MSHKHPSSEISDWDGPYLPLTAGSSKPLTGNLYIDAAAPAALNLRANGDATSYSIAVDAADTLFYLRKVTQSGQPVIRLDPYPNDGVSSALVQMFRTTNTTGTPFLAIYQGNNTATESHRLEGSGDAEFCKDGLGNVKILQGNLYIDKTANPSVVLREGGSATSYTVLEDTAPTSFRLSKIVNTGASYITLDPRPSDGTSSAVCRVFRETNTTGSVVFQIMEGDNTNISNHNLYGGGGNAAMCIQGGSITQGGTAVSLSGHTHDDRYYTEAETTAFLAGKSNTGHTHLEADITDLGVYLPLTAGSGKRITGDLYFENAQTIHFRNSGNTADIAAVQVTADNFVFLGHSASNYDTYIKGD